MKRRVAIPLGVAGALALGALIGWNSISPLNDRNWLPEQAVVATTKFDGARARIANARAFRYSARQTFEKRYVDRVLDLDKIESVAYVLSPFELSWRGPAHSFLTFGFADSQFVSISVEARREVGEEYDIWRGLVRRYEMFYVVGDERDLIGQRAAFGDDRVYLYPVKASRENIRRLFVAMLERANRIAEKPEFYNTATNNCTSSIIDHVNAIVPDLIPTGWRTVVPGYSDGLGIKLGLFDTRLPLEQARARYQINDRARRFLNDSLFSFRIRDTLGAGYPPSPSTP